MYYLGIVAIPIIILICAVIIDYATGISTAFYNSELSSKREIKGIVKKVGYLALVVAEIILDWMISQGLQQIAEGSNGGQLICYNCYAINNTRSNSSSNGSGFTPVNY